MHGRGALVNAFAEDDTVHVSYTQAADGTLIPQSVTHSPLANFDSVLRETGLVTANPASLSFTVRTIDGRVDTVTAPDAQTFHDDYDGRFDISPQRWASVSYRVSGATNTLTGFEDEAPTGLTGTVASVGPAERFSLTLPTGQTFPIDNSETVQQHGPSVSTLHVGEALTVVLDGADANNVLQAANLTAPL